MPLTWCGGLTYYTPSYKAGGRSDPANYRGICVSSCLGKIVLFYLKPKTLRLCCFFKRISQVSNWQTVQN